jgi:prevent-host-death family protein
MQVSSTKFRAIFFKLLDKLENNHMEIVITKRGKPIAKLSQINADASKDPLLGSLVGVGRTVGDLAESVVDNEEWELVG